MRLETLLYPGNPANGFMLRNEACKAISSVEIVAGRTPGGKIESAKTLADFFTDCASKLSTLYESVVPTVVSRVAASATQVNITYSEAMDQTVVPATTAFTITGDTITSIAWVSSTVLCLTGTGFAAAESLVYTKPATSYVRDLAGNAVASNTANMT
jgi:hypothetical protein